MADAERRHRSRAPARCSRSSPIPTTRRSRPAARWRSGAPPAARSICWCSRTATAARSDPAQDREELARIRVHARRRRRARSSVSRACGSSASTTASWRTPTTSARAVTRRIREVRAETRPVLSTPPLSSSGTATTTTPTTAPPGSIALDSVFPGSGNPHFFSEHLGEGLGVQDVTDVWLGWTNEPNHVEDVSDTSARRSTRSPSTTSQLAEGIAFFEEFLAEEAVKAGEKIGVAPRRGVPRPRSPVSGRTHGLDRRAIGAGLVAVVLLVVVAAISIGEEGGGPTGSPRASASSGTGDRTTHERRWRLPGGTGHRPRRSRPCRAALSLHPSDPAGGSITDRRGIPEDHAARRSRTTGGRAADPLPALHPLPHRSRGQHARSCSMAGTSCITSCPISDRWDSSPSRATA